MISKDTAARIFFGMTGILAAGLSAYLGSCRQLVVSYQKTGEVITACPVRAGDSVTVRLTHSFEHVPWNEYYTVMADGSFDLERIEVGGFGAGIPAEMDVPSYVGDDGLVHMDEIHSRFEKFTWITSDKNMKDLTLNGDLIVDFTKIPHHSFVECQVKNAFF